MTKILYNVSVKNYHELYRNALDAGLTRFDAMELLSCSAGLSKAALTRDFALEAAPEVSGRFHGLLARRLNGEPLAYIFGECEFYGLPFYVTADVLIPRPDSEPLVTSALEHLSSVQNARILDLCCGSGCLGLAVISNLPGSALTAVDIWDGALTVTKKNAERLGFSKERMTLKRLDVLQPPPERLGAFDLILANPPYVTALEMETALGQEVRDFEPHLALYGGEDGLDFYRSICRSWAKLLAPYGTLVLECAFAQEHAVRRLAEGIANYVIVPTGTEQI